MTFMKNILKNQCHKNKRPGIAAARAVRGYGEVTLWPENEGIIVVPRPGAVEEIPVCTAAAIGGRLAGKRARRGADAVPRVGRNLDPARRLARGHRAVAEAQARR